MDEIKTRKGIESSPVRQLRLWHWHQVAYYRTQAKLERSHIPRDRAGVMLAVSALSDAKADFHLKAVQILNESPDCEGTTAEDDAEVRPL